MKKSSSDLKAFWKAHEAMLEMSATLDPDSPVVRESVETAKELASICRGNHHIIMVDAADINAAVTLRDQYSFSPRRKNHFQFSTDLSKAALKLLKDMAVMKNLPIWPDQE